MKQQQPGYMHPSLPADARAKKLLKRMTIEEKVGQLVSTCPLSQLRESNYSDRRMIEQGKRLIDRGVGQIGVAVRHASPRGGPRIANELQRYALEESRLGIPILIQDECVHGCKANGSTMFPMSIGMAATWDAELMERVVHAIGKETRARGINQCFSPTLNIARDVRCGRVEETYGEDPYLVTRMGVAFIKTIQRYGIAATPKHFVANFVGDGGRDSHPVSFSERILREIYFPAFKAAVRDAGTLSLMIAHTAIDGVPCSANPWLMNDILRKEWGFEGFIVPDNTDVQKNHYVHFMADSWDQSAQWCIEAGLDTDLSWPPPDPAKLCYEDSLVSLVKNGTVEERFINESCTRVLRTKFLLGLFENPYVIPDEAVEITQCDAHRDLAREAAVKSMVLLKNEGSMLPFSKSVKKIAVIGPSATVTRLGGYTCANAGAVSPLNGILSRMNGRGSVRTAEGCTLAGDGDFEQAGRLARWAEVVVLCMGNSSDKIIGQPETTEGERHDRCNLDLPGVQEALIERIVDANPNVVVVLQNGSAITMQRWVGRVKAILEAWYPGAEGGNAIADVLFGDANPGGRLPITFPVTTGQCPLYYNPRPHGRVADYCDMRGPQAQFPFGHGLSYTRFAYSDLHVRKSKKNGDLSVAVRFTVKNTGGRRGDEVVQLYIQDLYSRITRPIKELRRFERITLKAGENRQIRFDLSFDDFAQLGADLKPMLEPGDFNIMLGSSSEDIRIEKTILL